MSNKFDFVTEEGRLKIWGSLLKTKAKNEKTVKVARIKNILVALVFALNNLLFTASLCDLLMKTREVPTDLLTGIPVLKDYIAWAAGYVDNGIVEPLVFGFIFTVVIPCVFALIVRIIVSLLIKKSDVSEEKLPEGDQIEAILKVDDEITAKVKGTSGPFGVMFGSAFVNVIAGAVCGGVMMNKAGFSLSVVGWISYVGVSLLALLVLFVFAFLASISFTYPEALGVREAYNEWNKTAEAERAEKERLAREEEARERARKEKEKLDAMTGEELYNFACGIEDNHEQLKYLYMAQKKGYADAQYMITVVERMIEEEKYARSKACMDAGWEAQSRGDYRYARSKFLEAARMDHPDGMYNYARLSFKFGDRQEAIRWLQKAIDSGTYDDADSRMLLAAMKRGDNITILD